MEKVFLSGAFKSFIKRRVFVTDGTIFRLHYQVTALLLTVFSILVSTTQFFGDPIQCMQTEDVPTKVLNTYCWIEGTFTLPKALNKTVGVEVVYPGVDKRLPEDDITIHSYYQWVCFCLLFQASLFYAPRLVWGHWEGGRMKSLLQELNSPIIPDEEKRKKFNHLIRYFKSNIHHHTGYAFKYLLCEFLTLCNVLGQIYLMDVFLSGEFSTYGLDVVRFASTDQRDRVDPMVKVFPRLTKCTFHHFGSSGDVKKYDSLCLLPLNIVNEKIYITLWFWFVILSILTCIALSYRILLLLWPNMRFLALHSMARLTPRDQVRSILKKSGYGDWFVLFLLAKNMEGIHYKEFMNELIKGIDSPHISTETSDVSSA